MICETKGLQKPLFRRPLPAGTSKLPFLTLLLTHPHTFTRIRGVCRSCLSYNDNVLVVVPKSTSARCWGMLELIFALSDAFWDSIWSAEGPFFRGIAAGVILSAFAAAVYWEIVGDRKKISFFFVTIEPSLKSSSSGYDRMIGCAIALLRLGFLFLTLAILVAGCVHSVVVP